MAGLALRLTIVVVAALVGGCAPSEPVVTSRPRPASLCIGLEPARCEAAIALLAGRPVGDGVPSYVQVSAQSCDGPCPGAERGTWGGHLLVEFVDGREAATILFTVDGAPVVWRPIETVLARLTPRSKQLVAPTVGLTLGHCGLSSGIDIDGSYWDPVGRLDPNEQDLINSASATFNLDTQSTATLRTLGGAIVLLIRHPGPKYVVPCD